MLSFIRFLPASIPVLDNENAESHKCGRILAQVLVSLRQYMRFKYEIKIVFMDTGLDCTCLRGREESTSSLGVLTKAPFKITFTCPFLRQNMLQQCLLWVRQFSSCPYYQGNVKIPSALLFIFGWMEMMMQAAGSRSPFSLHSIA